MSELPQARAQAAADEDVLHVKRGGGEIGGMSGCGERRAGEEARVWEKQTRGFVVERVAKTCLFWSARRVRSEGSNGGWAEKQAGKPDESSRALK